MLYMWYVYVYLCVLCYVCVISLMCAPYRAGGVWCVVIQTVRGTGIRSEAHLEEGLYWGGGYSVQSSTFFRSFQGNLLGKSI